jgi:hypothetical protein
MAIDWTVNIGAIVGGLVSGLLAAFGAYGAMQRFWHKVDLRITKAEDTLERHAAALTEHGAKATRHEGMLLDMLQDVAKIIGSIGGLATWRGEERRHS